MLRTQQSNGLTYGFNRTQDENAEQRHYTSCHKQSKIAINITFSAFARPALTTISIDNVALGQRGIEILAALQKGEVLPGELTRPIIPQLIARAST
jgi:DNA-binding LacI/PurR family transcriptional regulator